MRREDESADFVLCRLSKTPTKFAEHSFASAEALLPISTSFGTRSSESYQLNKNSSILRIAQNENVYQYRKKLQTSTMQQALSNAVLILRKQLPDWRHYLLPLMFLKYVSENWLAMRIDYIQQFPAQPGQIARNMEQQRFVLPSVGLANLSGLEKKRAAHRYHRQREGTCLATFQTLFERREDAEIGQIIDCVLLAWEHANPLELRGIFSHLRFHVSQQSEQAELRRKMWAMVLLELARFQLDSEARRTEYCRYWQILLGDLPITEEPLLSSLMTRLLTFSAQPLAPESIADPFCGNGGVITSSH